MLGLKLSETNWPIILNQHLKLTISLFKQVEWDEPRCGDKQNRVSVWEIDTPESLFIFPSLTSSLKRPLQSGYELDFSKF